MNRVMSNIKSPLRYPGGKLKALDQIMKHVPGSIGEYREPFVGGRSVFFAMRSLFGSYLHNYWLNDIYRDLYCYLLFARDEMPRLVEAVKKFKAEYPDGRALHTYLKDERHMTSDFDRAVRFFIMNRITFSGVMDAGGYSQGAFEKRFTDSSIERLAKIEPLLQGVNITNEDYEVLLTTPGDRVFIFLDPPYLSATQSKLYGVRGELHLAFDHERFAYNMQRCSHRWLITYDDSPEVRKLFSFAKIFEWQLQYGMNNFKQETAEIGSELFIRNY
jgi:DNA adenine methylase